MTTTYRGKPLTVGERIPRTELTFIGSILPRRGEFRCDCGKTVVYNMSAVESGERKTCGCGRFKRRKGIRRDA